MNTPVTLDHKFKIISDRFCGCFFVCMGVELYKFVYMKLTKRDRAQIGLNLYLAFTKYHIIENDFVNKGNKYLKTIIPGESFLFPVLICISIPAKLVTLLLGSNALIILATSVCAWDFEPIGREFWTSSIVSIVTAVVAFVGTALQTIVWVKWHKLKVLKKELGDL